jgi:hypothetical protein
MFLKSWLTNPLLVRPIGIGKAVGLLFGLAGFVLLPVLAPGSGWLLRWGVLLWYVTLGALVGMALILTRPPLSQPPMPWWLMAAGLGAWMNFVLTLFAHDAMTMVMVATFGENGMMQSPFWFVLEGAIVGLVIGYCITRFGGPAAAAKAAADR